MTKNRRPGIRGKPAEVSAFAVNSANAAALDNPAAELHRPPISQKRE